METRPYYKSRNRDIAWTEEPEFGSTAIEIHRRALFRTGLEVVGGDSTSSILKLLLRLGALSKMMGSQPGEAFGFDS